MIKVIIVDDESAAIDMMKAHLAPYSSEVQLCSTCLTISDAVRDIRLYKPDILFLDIELGEGLSFDILEQLPDLKAHVVFVTAYDHYALKAIKYHAFDYLLKPLVTEEFNTTFNDVMAKVQAQQQPDSMLLLEYLKSGITRKIAVPSRNGLNYYQLNDIVFIEADGSYAIMHLAGAKNITITKKVKDFEESLSDKGFLRVHKSYLVNLHHIAELHRDDSGYLLMSNNKKVPISPKDKESIIYRIKQVSNII